MGHILIVDDDPGVRSVVSRALRKRGHVVLEAENGAAALRRLEAHPVDVLLTDIFMPEVDGLELIRRVVRRFPSVGIVALSGGGRFGLLDMLESARKFGAAQVLEKPFTADQLLTAVDAALDGTAE